MEISPAALSWLGKRGIGEEIVVRFGLHTAEWVKNEDGEGGYAKPNPGGRLLVFPFIEGGSVVGEKYRTYDKKIWQKPGSANVLYNVDVLDDDNLADGTYPLIWTEGEIDCLSAIEAGFPHVVSVPMGAPSMPKNRKPEDLDPIDFNREGEGDFAFMWRSRDKIRRVRKHIIAVDNDAPGRRLAAELVRRLGPAKCSFVVYPEGCKDLNDVLMQHGAAGIAKLVAERKPYPVKGLFKITDYPDEPEPQTFPLGLRLDGNMKFYEGAFVVCTGVPSMGKALALDTEVPTPTGWRTIADLVPGDIVYDECGTPCRIEWVSEIAVGRPCYRLTFDDGTSIVADEDHQWFTVSEKARRSARHAAKVRGGRVTTKPRGTDQQHLRTFPSVVTTKEISATLYSQGKRNHQIPLAGAVSGVATLLPVDPYTLGAWLGDGHSADGRITSFDAEVIRAVGQHHHVRAQAGRGLYFVPGLQAKLRDLGVLGAKHIPEIYLLASFLDRLSLLKGLMDTDGYCDRRTRTCEFVSTNGPLAGQVRELAASLGLKVSWAEGDATLNGRVVNRRYRVRFVADFPVFTVARKIAAQRIGSPRRLRDRVIVSCQPVPPVPVKCIGVDSPSHLFLVTRSFIPTHNSTVVNALLQQIAELHGAKIAIASFEAKPSPYLRDQFRTMYLRKGRGQMTGAEMQEADRWIDERFVFIDHDPRDEHDDDLSLEWVIERAEDAVLRYGVRFLVLDPWNEIEHRRRREETIDDYTARAIRQLKRFCKSYRVCTIVVTHPTKDVRGKDGVVRRPGLYDISGSSAWYNKADIGFVVHREDGKGNDVQIHVEKVRHKFSGTKGEVTLTREPTTSRYVDVITEADIYHSEPL